MTHRRRIQEIRKRGVHLHLRGVVVYWDFENEACHDYVVVPKRRVKKAVRRNLLKRRLREAAKMYPVPGSRLFVVREALALRVPFAEWAKDLAMGLERRG